MGRIGWKQFANLAVVTLLGLAATGWAVINLAGWKPFDPPKHVTVRLAQSGGALPGAEVTYLGVPIGKVSGASLEADALELELEIRPKGPMAKTLSAEVRQKTSLGEPYVDLMPAKPGVPAGDPDGAVVPVERTKTPRPLNRLLQGMDELFEGIDPADVELLLEGASGIVEHSDELRAMLASGADLGAVVERRREELGQLIASSATIAEATNVHQAELARSLSGWTRLSDVLVRHRDDLERILVAGGRLGAEGSQLVSQIRPDLPGTLAGFEMTFHTLASRPQKVHEIMELTPVFVTRLGRTFDDHASWSSTGGLGQGPFQPTYAMPITGKGARVDKILLPQAATKIRAEFYDPRTRDSEFSGQMLRFLGPEEAAALMAGG